jgi:hypothetical protein
VTTGAFQSKNNGGANTPTNAFVTKLNPTGTALVYSTYLGGSGTSGCAFYDEGFGIAVDGSGDAYVTGTTCSTNFPVTTDAYQTVNNSTKASPENAFVTKLNPTGTALVYSTYLGGSALDGASAIAVDGSDYAYVTGSATSTNFPATDGAFQVTNNALTTSGWGSAFVTKLNTTAIKTYSHANQVGALSATLNIADNAAGSPQQVSLQTTVINPRASFTYRLNFGAVEVGNSSTKDVTVTNTGTTALDISSVGVTGPDAGDFAPTNLCPSSLAPTDTCTIGVRFAPSTTGSRTAHLTVTDNAKTSPQSVPLVGKGSN